MDLNLDGLLDVSGLLADLDLEDIEFSDLDIALSFIDFFHTDLCCLFILFLCINSIYF